MAFSPVQRPTVRYGVGQGAQLLQSNKNMAIKARELEDEKRRRAKAPGPGEQALSALGGIGMNVLGGGLESIVRSGVEKWTEDPMVKEKRKLELEAAQADATQKKISLMVQDMQRASELGYTEEQQGDFVLQQMQQRKGSEMAAPSVAGAMVSGGETDVLRPPKQEKPPVAPMSADEPDGLFPPRPGDQRPLVEYKYTDDEVTHQGEEADREAFPDFGPSFDFERQLAIPQGARRKTRPTTLGAPEAQQWLDDEDRPTFGAEYDADARLDLSSLPPVTPEAPVETTQRPTFDVPYSELTDEDRARADLRTSSRETLKKAAAAQRKEQRETMKTAASYLSSIPTAKQRKEITGTADIPKDFDSVADLLKWSKDRKKGIFSSNNTNKPKNEKDWLQVSQQMRDVYHIATEIYNKENGTAYTSKEIFMSPDIALTQTPQWDKAVVGRGDLATGVKKGTIELKTDEAIRKAKDVLKMKAGTAAEQEDQKAANRVALANVNSALRMIENRQKADAAEGRIRLKGKLKEEDDQRTEAYKRDLLLFKSKLEEATTQTEMIPGMGLATRKTKVDQKAKKALEKEAAVTPSPPRPTQSTKSKRRATDSEVSHVTGATSKKEFDERLRILTESGLTLTAAQRNAIRKAVARFPVQGQTAPAQ